MKFQPAIIDAAISSGVREFYPSEYGSDTSQGILLTNRYWRDKRITKSHLANTIKSHPGFNYTLIMVGGFMEFTTNEIFGIDTEKHTFDFYGSPDTMEPLTSTVDVAKIIVASTMLPKSATQVREFRAPTALYAWSEIIATIENAQGVKYECTYHPNKDARALQAEFAASGDVDKELAYSLKAAMGDPTHVGVPKPWNGDVFEWERVSLQAAMENMFSKTA